MRRSHLAVSVLLLVLAAQPLVAATFYVGTCKSGSFATISAAVSAVPAGSTVDVCPGDYREQVVIAKPLNLEGITSGGSSIVVIYMPSAGLTATSSLLYGYVAAQVQVTASPVNISGITVDGNTGGVGVCPNVVDAGIFYSSGSSGTLNEVQTLLQNCNTSGIGILAENGAGPSQLVTIENSCIQSGSDAGVVAYSDQTPPTLTASIKGNYVAGTNSGIYVANVDGSVSSNHVDATSGSYGIVTLAPSSSIKGNTVTAGSYYGIAVDAGSKITDNLILVAVGQPTSGEPGEIGINLNAGGATVSNNTIVGTDFASYYSNLAIGIEFNCNAATVSGNVINGAETGLDQVPAGFTGVNRFYNTEFILGGTC